MTVTRATVALVGLAVAILVVIVATGPRGPDDEFDQTRRIVPEVVPANDGSSESYEGFIYGRVTTDQGDIYEGRLRWGGGEESFWGDYFNGTKDQNPWAGRVPPERITERSTVRIFGFRIASRERTINLGRPFLSRFGDISRIEASDSEIHVTLKSGTTFVLDRFAADDLADGLRVWDAERGVVDLGEWQVRVIEFGPTVPFADTPSRLFGTVETPQGNYTGFIQWDRREGVGTDELNGRDTDGEVAIPFGGIRSIARNPPDGSLVTLIDGREVALSGSREVGPGNSGIYVDDVRYGRVLVFWNAVERADFAPGDSGPAFGEFRPGLPLTGTVVTRDGSRMTGRLVYDLDESETTETLDAAFGGVNYNIPFGLIASIRLPERTRGSGPAPVSVILHSGEELPLNRTGDLADGVGGLLIFTDESEDPNYVLWSDVARIDFDRSAEMYPILGEP